MKSKKGFTLVELIAVLVIIITISLMAVPAVLKMIRRNKETAYDTKQEIILKQAKQYARDNESFLFDSKKKYLGKVCNSITVKQLLDAGYLKELSADGSNSGHIINPLNNESIEDSNIIIYINSKKPSDPDKMFVGTYVSLFRSANWCKEETPAMTFAYTGAEQSFVVSETGYYRLQTWGAQGGYENLAHGGGLGGYAEGIVYLTEGETVYVYVGGSGNTGGLAGGFNGGGAGVSYKGGGGATDFRVEGNTQYHRILVAGGGGSGGRGGSMDGGYGGAGGGYDGLPCTNCGSYGGGSQTGPGSAGGGFGYGEPARNTNNCGGIDGSGGGGWYGGSAGDHSLLCFGDQGGSGGSAFAYDGTNTVPEDYAVINHYLLQPYILSGNSDRVPNYEGDGYMHGNEGNGYAKVSFVGETL